MQVRYQGFRLFGSVGTSPHDLFDHILNNPTPGCPFFKEIALGNTRTIPIAYDRDSSLYKGIVVTTSPSRDLLTIDEVKNETYLFHLDKPQIKMNFFIFSVHNNAGLYTSYDESLPLQDFARVISQPFRRLNDSRYFVDHPENETKAAKVQLERKYYPNGRRALKLIYIVTEKTFQQMLRESSGLYDLDIVVDAEKIVPALASRRRMKATIKTARLNIQFEKEFLNRTVVVAQAIISALNAEGHKARLVENARERTIYSSSNKEYFHQESYDNIRQYLSVSLANFASCGIFKKMQDMVANHSLFQPTPVGCDDDE